MHLTQDSIDAIFKQAVSEYPAECCGMVTSTGTVQRVRPLVNIQEQLHAGDPETHPRDSRTAYAVDRNEVERIMSDAASHKETILAFYHSHIDFDAYFSQMDKEVQTVFGEPEFPDAVHVVVSVREGKIHEMKGYLWNSTTQDFEQVEVR